MEQNERTPIVAGAENTNKESDKHTRSTSPLIFATHATRQRMVGMAAAPTALPNLDGMFVSVKFKEDKQFENRFVWIDLERKTFNVSEHMIKTRQHKSVRLAAIVALEKSNPQSFESVDVEAEAQDGKYITATLGAGGCTHFRFQDADECDCFYSILSSALESVRDDTVRLANLVTGQPLLDGMLVNLKFTKDKQFEERFIWVNLERKIFNMSQFTSKDRRHKEAYLRDIVTVEKANPQSFLCVDALPQPQPQSQAQDDVYVTVMFVRGSGIDIMFENADDCDVFYSTLSGVVKRLKENPRPTFDDLFPPMILK